MIMSYNSILGVPTLNENKTTKNNNTQGFVLGSSSLLLFLVILIVFIMIFANLGKKGNTMDTDTSNSSGSNSMAILMGGVLLTVFLLNGMSYFFNINLTAEINNLFTTTPTLDITVEETEARDEVAPIPEITIEPQVYHIPGNKYTYDNAEALCKAYGSRLATYDEMEDAYEDGAEWCSYGWSEKQLGLFPTQKETWDHLQTVPGHENDCGRPGINGGYIANKNVKFGANCFGYKPRITDEEKEIMDNTPLYPKTMEDIEQEKRVDFWKKRIPDILVAPFNKKVWSLI
jgi:hypothetical protein